MVFEINNPMKRRGGVEDQEITLSLSNSKASINTYSTIFQIMEVCRCQSR